MTTRSISPVDNDLILEISRKKRMTASAGNRASASASPYLFNGLPYAFRVTIVIRER